MAAELAARLAFAILGTGTSAVRVRSGAGLSRLDSSRSGAVRLTRKALWYSPRVWLEENPPPAAPAQPAAPAAHHAHSLDTATTLRLRERLGALFEVVLCSDFPTQLLLMQLLALFGVRPFVEGGQLSMTYVAVLSLSDAALLVAIMLWLLRRHGERPRDLFIGPRSIARELQFGALLIPGIVLLVVGVFTFVQRFAPWLHNVPENPLESLIRTPLDASVFAVVAIVAGGVREEMQRAFILRRFEQHLGGGAVGLLVFSVAFGAGHIIQGWDAALITALLGLIWGVVYLRRRSIVAPLVSHSSFNLIEIVRHLTA